MEKIISISNQSGGICVMTIVLLSDDVLNANESIND
jgi:hypothetical protein